MSPINETAPELRNAAGTERYSLSLDFQNAEDQYALEPADLLSPEKLFEKSWALTVLERTMDRLEKEMAEKKERKLFEHLKVYLTTDKDVRASGPGRHGGCI